MRRSVAVAIVTAGLLCAAVAPVSAHQPVVLGKGDTTAASGPLLPDGTISWAVYGTVAARRTQGFRVTFAKGDPMLVDLLIPANGTERSDTTSASPRVRITPPSGREVVLRPTQREAFTETFTLTSYVRLARYEAVAGESGTFRVTVDADAPMRWCVAIGTTERFDVRPRDEDRPTGIDDIARWYRSRPGR